MSSTRYETVNRVTGDSVPREEKERKMARGYQSQLIQQGYNHDARQKPENRYLCRGQRLTRVIHHEKMHMRRLDVKPLVANHKEYQRPLSYTTSTALQRLSRDGR